MQLTVNGETQQTDQTTLVGLLESLSLKPEHLVCELNGCIIAREDYATTALHEGDTLELVHFVGGG